MTSVNIRRSPITYMPECFALFFSTRCTPKNCYLDYDFINQQAQIYRERVTFAISINAQKKRNSSFELLLSKIGENSNDVLISGE